MTPKEFAREFRLLRDDLLKDYFDESGEISLIGKFKESGLNKEQIELVKDVMSEGLTDALYTILLGLDGCAQIGEYQINYSVYDEENNQVAGSGVMEEFAYEYLQENINT